MNGSGPTYRVSRQLADAIVTHIDVYVAVTIDEVRTKFKLGRVRTALLLKKLENDGALVHSKGRGRTLLYHAQRTPKDAKLIHRVVLKHDGLRLTYAEIVDNPGSTRAMICNARGINERTLRKHLGILRVLVSESGGRFYAENPGLFQVDVGSIDFTVAASERERLLAARKMEKSRFFVATCIASEHLLKDLVNASEQAVQAFSKAGRDPGLIRVRSYVTRFEEAWETFSQGKDTASLFESLEPAAALVECAGKALAEAGDLLSQGSGRATAQT